MIRRHITPALLFFIPLLASCCTGTTFPWPVLLAVSAAPGAFGVVLLRLPSPVHRRAALLALAACAGLAAGAACVGRMSAAIARAYLPVPAAEISDFSGVLGDDSILTTEGTTVLRVSLRSAASVRSGVRGEARGSVVVFLEGDWRFSMGERIAVHASLAPSLRPGSREQFVAGATRDVVRKEGFDGRAWALRADMRGWLHGAAARAGYPASALMEALLIGSREDVPRQLYEGFKRTGSLHILALSGLHVTVIFGIIAGMLRFLKNPGLKFAMAALILVFYQCLAGFLPSLLRATVMILVGGTARLLDRDAEPLNLLCISGALLLLADPWQALSLSFQLSFLALAGILLIGPLVQRPLEGRLPRFLLLPLSMSVGAQCATLPLVFAMFGTWYPSGLAAGLLLVPLTTALLWGALAWLALFAIPWPLLHDLCARGFALLYDAIQGCAEFFGRAPGISAGPAELPWVVAGTSVLVIGLGVLLPLRARAPARAA
jgi:competence protein ComEC